jgi:hypothetical protein
MDWVREHYPTAFPTARLLRVVSRRWKDYRWGRREDRRLSLPSEEYFSRSPRYRFEPRVAIHANVPEGNQSVSVLRLLRL